MTRGRSPRVAPGGPSFSKIGARDAAAASPVAPTGTTRGRHGRELPPLSPPGKRTTLARDRSERTFGSTGRRATKITSATCHTRHMSHHPDGRVCASRTTPAAKHA